MKLWLPYIRTGSGVDVYTRRLAVMLRDAGVEVKIQSFPYAMQYVPWLLKAVPTPPETDLILTNSWNAFAFARPGTKLVTINHLCVFDDLLTPYKCGRQTLFHEQLLRRFERWGYARSSAVVAVSSYTAQQMRSQFPGVQVQTLHNGVDTEFFSPECTIDAPPKDGLDILFVGNLSRRKGADLLPRIMHILGPRHRLHYTSGLRPNGRLPSAPNLHPLGSLNQTEVRDAYRRADLVLLPTRLEGLPLVLLESMACGKPVVASAVASLPEIIDHGRTGLLCPVDDVEAFAAAIQSLSDDADQRRAMGVAARQTILENFSTSAMADRYMALFDQLLANRH